MTKHENAPLTDEAILSLAAKQFRNKGHQRAFFAGFRIALNGETKFCPYSSYDRTSQHFKRAWHYGHAEGLNHAPPAALIRGALRELLDVTLRCDPEYVDKHHVARCTDDEMDAAIARAEQALAK